ncbi:MAG: DoxX family protein [Hyphomicrobium sp.]
MSTTHALISLVARVLLAVIFIKAGFGKFSDPAGTIGYMQTSAFPIPAPEMTVYAVAALELFGGLGILFGLGARVFAFALAVFTIAAAAGFHANFSDQIQTLLFTKNMAIAGGLLLLAVNGPGAYSVKSNT